LEIRRGRPIVVLEFNNLMDTNGPVPQLQGKIHFFVSNEKNDFFLIEESSVSSSEFR